MIRPWCSTRRLIVVSRWSPSSLSGTTVTNCCVHFPAGPSYILVRFYISLTIKVHLSVWMDRDETRWRTRLGRCLDATAHRFRSNILCHLFTSTSLEYSVRPFKSSKNRHQAKSKSHKAYIPTGRTHGCNPYPYCVERDYHESSPVARR